ncbi:MAG: YciI family protein [Pseudomonadota bacterium]
MMFIIELTFTQPLEEIIKKYGADHGNYLDRYYQSGHFVVSGPQNPKVGGVYCC